MATYFMFGIYDADALDDISAERTRAAHQVVESTGGKIEALYVLMGDTDLVLIADFPDARKAIKASIELSKLTGISFSTTPAMKVQEFDQLIAGD